MVNHMKIVKRDGRTVDYNPDKIRVAIGKANDEVMPSDKISSDKIEEIIRYVESLDKKRMLVEDIQDIIEFKLMEYGLFNLAKKYIIYRYKRSIIRQSNTTDASILSIMKNGSPSSGNYLVANRQREIMAGEASMDLAYRLLLPKNVVEADRRGHIKFSKVEHFTEPVVESIKLNLTDMFDKGTTINGVQIETPKSFQSACNVLIEIIGAVSSCQTGAIYVDLKDLFKYYDTTFEKKYSLYKSLLKSALPNDQIRALTETQSFLEMKTGIQTIFYQLNTITLANGCAPLVYFLIDINEITSEHDEKVVFEFVREKIHGIKKDNGTKIPSIPALLVNLDTTSECGRRYDYILKELMEANIEFIGMNPNRFLKFKKDLGRFNQGSMILNLAKIALDYPNENYLAALEANLSYCYEGFLCRNHNLQGVYSDKSPIHWMHGAIARLETNEKIDGYLKKDRSTLKLNVVGFEAATKILEGDENIKVEIGNLIVATIKKWNKENSFEVVLSNYCDEAEKLFLDDELELKKFGVKSYFDSLEFMKSDYFEEGFLYAVVTGEENILELSSIYDDLIIKKEIE